jgi:hypothetical protein
MRIFAVAVSLCVGLAASLAAQSVYTTGFEPGDFALGDVTGQHGWGHFTNSPTGGTVVATPPGSPAMMGSQSLSIFTRDAALNGVTNNLYSTVLAPAAGETGSTAGGVAVVSPGSTFTASVWYRTPDVPPVSPRADHAFAELDPSSKGGDIVANRSVQLKVANTTNDGAGLPFVFMRWTSDTTVFTPTVATLAWGTWYHFVYRLHLVDGVFTSAGVNSPNDVFRFEIRDVNDALLGSVCGSTLELGYKSGGFGGGSTPRGVDGFDFFAITTTTNTIAGYLDEMTMSVTTPAALAVDATGTTSVCAGGTTTLTAAPSGGSGTYTSYTWFDGANTQVGTGTTLIAGAGTYTVKVTDTNCDLATDTIMVSPYAPLSVAITGNLTVCFGAKTTLTASPSGGSGSIASYTWRDASNAVVGTSSTLLAAAGSYTLAIADTSCGLTANASATVTTTCPGTPTIVVSGGPFTYDGAPHAATAVALDGNNNPVSGTFALTYDGNASAPTNAGSYFVGATFTSSDPNYTDASGDGTLVINPATPAITISGGPFVYDNAPHGSTAVARDANNNVIPGAFSFTYDGVQSQPVDVGTYPVVATFTSSDPNFSDTTANGTLIISPATPTIAVSGGPFTYDATQHSATATALDASNEPVTGTFSFTYNGSATAPANAGVYAVVATFTSSDPNFADATGNGTLIIQKATPTVKINGGPFVYTGAPHAATAVATDFASNAVSGTFSFTYNGSGIAPTNVGTYNVSATFTSGDPNFNNAAGEGLLDITQAQPTITVSGGPFTYDGTPHAATITATDASNNAVGGTFAVTYNGSATVPTNAGTYAVSVSFTSSNPNLSDGAGEGSITINPATPAVVISGGPFVYDGAQHAATAIARDANSNPVVGSMSITYDGSFTAPANAGSHAVVASFTSGDPNFSDTTGNGTLVITPATPIVTVSGGPFTYDGAAHAATAIARDASNNVIAGTFTFTYNGAASAINAGSYAVVASFTSSNPNFANTTGSGTLIIDKATPTVTLSGGPFVYDGAPHSATGVARDAANNVIAGSFAFTYDGSATLPVNVGTYNVGASFTSSNPNFGNAGGEGLLTITQATPVVTVSGGPFTYDGAAHAATAAARDASNNAVSGTFSITYNGSPTVPVNAGSYAIVATFTSSNPNFTNAVGNGTLVINPAMPAITITGGPFTFDGAAHAVTAVARDASNNIVAGTFAFTYNGSAGAPSNAATYAVVATFTSSDPNFASTTGNGTLVINRATPIVTWSNPASIVYGTALSATQLNATPSVPGTFTYTPPSGTMLNAGASQTLSTDFAPTDATNYNAVLGTTVLINVTKAPTSIAIGSIVPSPASAGTPVAINFTLTAPGTPGGTVTITDGVTSCTAAATATKCTMTFPTAGPRTLVATYSGDANRFGSASAGATVNVTTVTATSTMAGTQTMCAGTTATVSAILTGSAPWHLTWSDGFAETATSPIHHRTVSPSTTTLYAITSISDANGAGVPSGRATVTVVVVTPPSILNAPTVLLGEPLALHATPGYASYQWFRNGAPIAGATSADFTIASVAQSDFGAYSVVATNGGCSSAASAAFSLTPLALPTDDAVIPVVGNTHGANGALFRTTLHLVNATEDPMQGEITFLAPDVPSYPYTLAPHETRFIEDLLPSTFSGLTSANVRRTRGPLPAIVAHVFNDGGTLGTSGLIERAVAPAQMLATGDRAVLLTPIAPATTRFNIGLRSLGEQLRLRITRRSADGQTLATIDRVLPASTFVQEPVTVTVGATAIGSSESLTFEVLAGHGVIYGAAVDNRTNDPNMQLAMPIVAANGTSRFVLPVAGATRGAFNAQFATGLQIYNPGDTPLAATLLFHPAGVSGSDNDPRLDVTVQPRATLAMDDLVTSMHTAGVGSLDVRTSGSVRPVTLARVYNIAEIGQTSLSTELVAEESFLTKGQQGVVAASHAPQSMRFNVGVRTLGDGAQITATVRNKGGDVVKVAPLTFGPSYFAQSGAPQLLGVTLTGDESVVFTIDEGSAVVYGAWVDNVTQDPALQYAVRP